MTIKDVSEAELLAIAEHLATKRDDRLFGYATS